MARILLVEDDRYFRAMTRGLLAEGGHSVVEAEDGAAALEAFRRGAFDLVIMDLLMPEKDGIETITEMKRDFPTARIIAMSGGGQYAPKEEYLRVARIIGATEALTKPFTAEVLLSAVSRVAAS